MNYKKSKHRIKALEVLARSYSLLMNGRVTSHGQPLLDAIIDETNKIKAEQANEDK